MRLLRLQTPELQRLTAMTAAKVHSLSGNPEEDALLKILDYAKSNGLTDKTGPRLFGRNIYPTDAPEPHGYEYYLTGVGEMQPNAEVAVGEVPAGLYATLEVTGLYNLGEGWKSLFGWVESSGHQPVGVTKGTHGWVNSAFEELLSWQENKQPSEWVFRLWVQLKEEGPNL